MKGMLAIMILLVGTIPASAQVNCAAASPQMRAWCYQQSARIYYEQSQAYNNIARQQYYMHQNIGRGLRYVPMIGRPVSRAWNAPRYYYNFRY